MTTITIDSSNSHFSHFILQYILLGLLCFPVLYERVIYSVQTGHIVCILSSLNSGHRSEDDTETVVHPSFLIQIN